MRWQKRVVKPIEITIGVGAARCAANQEQEEQSNHAKLDVPGEASSAHRLPTPPEASAAGLVGGRLRPRRPRSAEVAYRAHSGEAAKPTRGQIRGGDDTVPTSSVNNCEGFLLCNAVSD